jgi:hypothetical protein
MEGEALVKPANVAFLSLLFCDVVRIGAGVLLVVAASCAFDCSGENEGKDVNEGSLLWPGVPEVVE